jgi:hypothetical protein
MSQQYVKRNNYIQFFISLIVPVVKNLRAIYPHGALVEKTARSNHIWMLALIQCSCSLKKTISAEVFEPTGQTGKAPNFYRFYEESIILISIF